MEVINTVSIAIGLAMDAFAVSIASGIVLPQVTRRHIFRMAFHFGLFQALMPVIGYAAGSNFSAYIAAFDHWIALILLVIIGVKMIIEGENAESEVTKRDPTKGYLLMTLALATSIDALAVGFSFAILGQSIIYPAITIGVITALLSAIGLLFGKNFGSHWQKIAARLGGIILIAIGLRIFISHILE